MKLYIVWNDAMNEGVVFNDHADAYWTAYGHWPPGYHSNLYPTLGEQFREIYNETPIFKLTEIGMRDHA